MSDDNAKLASLGKDYEFAIHEGTVGPSVIDVSTLYGQSGQFTYDPGLPPPQLQIDHHLYRWRRRHTAAPWVSD